MQQPREKLSKTREPCRRWVGDEKTSGRTAAQCIAKTSELEEDGEKGVDGIDMGQIELGPKNTLRYFS